MTKPGLGHFLYSGRSTTPTPIHSPRTSRSTSLDEPSRLFSEPPTLTDATTRYCCRLPQTHRQLERVPAMVLAPPVSETFGVLSPRRVPLVRRFSDPIGNEKAVETNDMTSARRIRRGYCMRYPRLGSPNLPMAAPKDRSRAARARARGKAWT